MSAFATLTISNGTTNDSFVPSTLSNNLAIWRKSASVYDAQAQLSNLYTGPKVGSSVVRVKQKVVIPKMDTVDATKKVSEFVCNIEFIMPKNSTDTERDLLRNYVISMVSNAITTGCVNNLQGVY
jgi:hypothetical protein